MQTRIFQTQTELSAPIDRVFQFFADASNLERITPPWLRFRIISPTPIDIREGSIIDYRLRVRGFPIRWRTVIESWDPPHAFVDRALRSPYRLWRHTHTFEPSENGVRMTDRVEYAPPLACITDPLFVRREIERIFEYRRLIIQSVFPAR